MTIEKFFHLTFKGIFISIQGCKFERKVRARSRSKLNFISYPPIEKFSNSTTDDY